MRRTMFSAALAAFAVLAAPLSLAADYPTRPVRFLVGFAPGGGTDILARLIAQQLTQKWGQPVVVENRPGATGKIAEEVVANAPPDGYTILMVNNSFTINAGTKLSYDPAKAFTPIIRPAMTPDVLVANPTDLKARNIKDVIAIAKADPQKLFYGTPGELSPPHMEMELLKKMAGVNITHVPYSGSGPAMLGVLKGDIQLTFASVQGAVGAIEAGKLVPIGISTTFRSPRLPDVPTIAESGLPGYDGGGAWYGVLAPAGMPPDVTARINADILAAIKSAEVKQKLDEQGFIVLGDSPADFASFVQKDTAKWDDLLRSMGKK